MLDKLFTFEDKQGNFFHCKDGKITLQLKSEDRRRKIGEVYVDEKTNLTIYKKFEDENQIHRKTNAWSIPVGIFEKVDGIWFFTDNYNYKILTKNAKKHMSYLTFKNVGYEPKVYIPLQLWNVKPV